MASGEKYSGNSNYVLKEGTSGKKRWFRRIKESIGSKNLKGDSASVAQELSTAKPKSNVRQRENKMMKKTAAVGMASVLAATMTACSASDSTPEVKSEYAKVCVDKTTTQRLEDEKCDDEHKSAHSVLPAWYFMHMATNGNNSRNIPAVGQKVDTSAKSGTFDAAKAKSAGKVSAKGGEMKSNVGKSGNSGNSGKGGFGHSSGSHGG